MTMPDYPAGEWSPWLVGPQWVGITSVIALNNALANRGTIVTNFTGLHDTLWTAINTTLAGQEGATAEAIRKAFQDGAEQAFQIAKKNGTYVTALQRVHDSVIELREKLTSIAEKGNKDIKDIQGSKEDFETKVAKIAQVIANCQRDANQAAMACAGDINAAGQNVLDAQGTGGSFWAKAAGIDMNQQPDLKAIEDQIRGKLNQPASPAAAVGGAGQLAPPGAPASAPATGDGGAGGQLASSGAPPPALSAAPEPAGPTAGRDGNVVPGAAVPAAPAAAGPTAGRSDNVVPAPAALVPAAVGGIPAPPHMSAAAVAAPQVPAPSMPAAPSPQGMPAGWGPTNPTGMAPGLNTGVPAGAPTPSAATALPAGPVNAMGPQAPPSAPTAPMAGAGVPAHVPVFETPPPIEHSPAPEAPPASSPPVVAGPATPAAPVAAAPPPAPAGPLPAYGADIRPPVASASTPAAPLSPPPPTPPPTTSGSAPVHPAGGQAGVGQPALVRQPATPAPSQSPPGIGTNGVMATVAGAVAGAVSADATARARLQRLVESVARQQPALAWAAGDRPDNTTVLVTDLASGWIPPGVELPAAVTPLEPARRRGDLEALLGEVTLVAAYTPGHYIPEDDEPVRCSPLPRRAPEIEELGWELNRATHWRDGLPQLAHTLAKAASRGTGVLDSEIDLLHEELTKVAAHILEVYPDQVDPDQVGDWQLLAAIDALVAGDKTVANYHLAWFLACNTTTAKASSG